MRAANGDKETGIQTIFDKDKVTADVQAQVQITQTFSQQAPLAVANYAASQMQPITDADKYLGLKEKQALAPDSLTAQQQEQLKQMEANGYTVDKATADLNNPQYQANYDTWKEGGTGRVIAHTVMGALGGGVSGALGAAAVASAAPTLNELQTSLQTGLVSAGLPASVAQGLATVAMQGVALGVGAVASGGSVTGATTALGVDANNRQLHPVETKLIKDNAKRFAQTVYGTSNPTAAQVEAATAMLANTAQNQLDNNMDGNVPYFKAANDFLQTLKVEYMQQNGTLTLAGTEGQQQLFYATVEQKNQPRLNQGLADPKITNLIVKTPLASAKTNSSSGPTPNANGCITAECAAGVLPTANDNRTGSQIDASLDRTTTNIALTPAVLAAGVAAAPTTLLGSMATGAALAGGNNVAVQLITTGTVNPTEAVIDTAAGAVLGAVGYGVTVGISNSLNGAAVAAEQKVINAARIENNVRADDTLQYVNNTAPINVPAVVTRSDNNFAATTNDKGALKAFINEQGDLVSANPAGTGSIQSQVRGGNSQNSSLISTTDPTSAEAPKVYGSQKIEIDTRNLQRDVNSGQAAQNIEIIPPSTVQEALENRVAEAQRRFDNNPSKNNSDSLKRARDDLANTQRDGECLISPCIPSTYIKITNGTTPTPAVIAPATQK
ncbi:hypothetical protein J2X19_003130 [Rhodoferax ferrireducens]|uniref:Uncharacterized protein n=1 Tax=Rhodoferax ferrireducens TaxID=192843 RepID=A0ABU2CAU8_9BURK|nr:hypothetical protein [Rhodoferax ferrireducens]MDR7378436.1 hypothetical protein [Rhodoferax ferrireducens]